MLSSGVDKALAAQEQRDSTAGRIRWVLRRYLGGRQPDISDGGPGTGDEQPDPAAAHRQ